MSTIHYKAVYKWLLSLPEEYGVVFTPEYRKKLDKRFSHWLLYPSVKTEE